MTTLATAALAGTAALTALTVLLLLAVAVEHGRRSRRLADEARRRAELTPLVHAVLDGDDAGPTAPDPALDPTLAVLDPALAVLDPALTVLDPALTAPELLDDLVLDLLPQLRGGDRAVLRDLLVRRGVVDRAAGDLRARAAWRRGRAATLLGNAAGEEHTPLLAALLTDRDPGVRCAAARALGKAGDPHAVDPLLGAAGVTPPLPHGVLGMAVLDLGVPALPALRAALTSARPAPVRALAAELVGLHGDVQAQDALVGLVRDDRQPTAVRAAAIGALGRIGSPEATRWVASALGAHQPPVLRTAAAEALGRIGDPAALAALTTALTDGAARRVRTACADALAAAGEPGRARLTALAASSGPAGQAARAALDLRPAGLLRSVAS